MWYTKCTVTQNAAYKIYHVTIPPITDLDGLQSVLVALQCLGIKLSDCHCSH